MTDRNLGSYKLRVLAGPASAEVFVDVEYFDDRGQLIGCYGEGLIAFCCTWKDIASAVRTGLQKHGLDHDPVVNVSPMVDLS